MSGGLRRAGLYWHTVRHLKPSQLWCQLRNRLTVASMPPDLPPPAERMRIAPEAWVPPAPRPNSLHADGIFEFLRVRATWEAAVADPAARELLWQYRFHDFEDLVAVGADRGLADGIDSRRPLHASWIARWITAFPPLASAAWDPYPVSMRVGNWVRWALAGGTLDGPARASMARQLHHLEQRLEFHLRANHLLENAKALYLGGSFLAGTDADRLRARGRALLLEQVAEQVLADGGHYERSPMYHGLMLEALQDCAACARVFGDDALAAELAPTLAAMDRWLRAMTHPDGGIAFFQDACHGVALPPSALHARSAALCKVDDSPLPPALHLEASGYVRLQQEDAVLFLDAGAPGPRWQPGHAHAGALSIEFSLGERRVFVNTGISRYGGSAERLQQRGTPAHNTVCLDGRNSSEVWDAFRVARRARVGQAFAKSDPEAGELRAGAVLSGYVGMSPGKARHNRNLSISCYPGFAQLEIEDWLAAPAIVSLHLHPEVEVVGMEKDPRIDGASAMRLRIGGRDLWVRFAIEQLNEVSDRSAATGAAPAERMSVEDAIYAQGFGVETPNKVLRLSVPESPGRRACTWLTWEK